MQNALQLILSTLYAYSSGVSWSILSYPSSNLDLNCLNVASPSFTSEYWITTFKANTRPVFGGTFPDWAEYSSLSAYDDQGLLIPGSAVNSFDLTPRATIDLMNGVDSEYLTRPYAVIHRVYRPPGRTQGLLPREKFNVYVNGTMQLMATEVQARSNGKQLQPELQEALGKSHPDIRPNYDMYKPSDHTLPGLFPNSDALYLVSSPSHSTVGVRLEGCLADDVPWVKYLGYMTTDMYTTATGGTYEVGTAECYVLYVTKAHIDPSDYGYDPTNDTHHTLRWTPETLFPTLVLRIVDTSCSMGHCKYLMNHSYYTPPTRCASILGGLYPTTQVFLTNLTEPHSVEQEQPGMTGPPVRGRL